MCDDFSARQRRRPAEHLAAFLAANPECALDRDEPQWLKGTHLVTFGSCRGEPAVFKFCDGDPRKEHEKRTLDLFAPTGLVPRVFDETDLMIVIERKGPGPFFENAVFGHMSRDREKGTRSLSFW